MRKHLFKWPPLWLCIGAIVASTWPAPVQADNVVRVRLFDLEAPTRVRVTSHERAVGVYAAEFEDPIAQLGTGEEAVVSRASGQLHIQIGSTGVFANRLRFEASGNGETVLSVVDGRSKTDPRSYEGRVRISLDESGSGLVLINEVDLEDYVAAVVSAEYGFDDLEGSKAMAVIIRTYTLAVMDKYGDEYDHVDHTLSQVYRGTGRITPVIREAVRQTKGEVLTHRGELIEAVYFAASGGHTADNETVWNSKAIPYLRGKPDPYGMSAPNAEWTARIPRSRLLSALSAEYGDVTGFVLGERGGDGRVRSVELLSASGGRRSIRANEFRMLVLNHFGAASLRSTMFTARREGSEYVFEGKGSGHGVGLSQWGTHELGQRSTHYREILDFYYTDVRVASLDQLTVRREVTPPSVEPMEESPPASKRIGW